MELEGGTPDVTKFLYRTALSANAVSPGYYPLADDEDKRDEILQSLEKWKKEGDSFENMFMKLKHLVWNLDMADGEVIERFFPVCK
jgi:hypothetical protein